MTPPGRLLGTPGHGCTGGVQDLALAVRRRPVRFLAYATAIDQTCAYVLTTRALLAGAIAAGLLPPNAVPDEPRSVTA